MEIEIDEAISIVQYETVIDKDIKKISQYLDAFLLQHQIKPEEINSLFLTGGTSMVLAIKNLFKDRFPDTPMHTGDNFMSVAKGLAYSGYLFNEE
ncbi:putative chaperone [compost metagenome]